MLLRRPRIATNIASDFLTRCFAQGETIALLLKRESPSAMLQRIVPLPEQNRAWVLHELASGKDAAKLTGVLAPHRSDKPNPLYYAQRTVDVVSATSLLIEGIPIGDVITMLEVRRRFEVSAALCCARAREIAATAQRMIARRKIA